MLVFIGFKMGMGPNPAYGIKDGDAYIKFSDGDLMVVGLGFILSPLCILIIIPLGLLYISHIPIKRLGSILLPKPRISITYQSTK